MARQFVSMSRVRVEGLLAAFPKLVRAGSQHTYVETESVRYVYLPLDQLYVLCVTNKGSNILEDLETLHLISKLVPEYCGGTSEAAVSASAFDLVAAIDEVLIMGNKEKVTLSQVNTYTTADSHEEKIFDMVRSNKEREVKDIRERKIAQLDKAKKDGMGGGSFGGGSGGMAGFGSGSGAAAAMAMGGGMAAKNNVTNNNYHSNTGSNTAPGGFGSNTSLAGAGAGAGSASARSVGAGGAGTSSGGMGLGGGSGGLKLGGSRGKSKSLLEQMSQEGAYSEAEAMAGLLNGGSSLGGGTAGVGGAGGAGGMDPARQGVHVAVEETVSLVLERDGGFRDALEIKGSVSLVVSDPESARFQVVTDVSGASGFKFTTHPHINKTLFNKQGLIGLKKPEKPFPTSGTPLQVLRWKKTSTDEGDVPLNVTCWPSSDVVSIQYELQDESLSLANVMIAIPVPGGQTPSVSGDAPGSYHFTGDAIIWALPLVDGDNPSGDFEFSAAPGLAEELYFPVHVSFEAPVTLSGVSISSVVPVGGEGGVIPHSEEISVKTGNYQVIDA